MRQTKLASSLSTFLRTLRYLITDWLRFQFIRSKNTEPVHLSICSQLVPASAANCSVPTTVLLLAFRCTLQLRYFSCAQKCCTEHHWLVISDWRWRTVWQLQPKVVQTVQQHVSYEFIWIRIRTFYYISLKVHYCMLSSRIRVRIRVGIRFNVSL